MPRRCGCGKQASYGLKRPTHCAPCAAKSNIEGMRDVVNKTCAADGCTVLPSFGLERCKAMYCKVHAVASGVDGMRDVKSRKCAADGCEKQPHFGIERSKPTHCKAHAATSGIQGMRNVLDNKRCVTNGCTTMPSYGIERGKPTHCAACARTSGIQGMRDVVNKRCAVDGCSKHPCYGLQRGKPTHCSSCAAASGIQGMWDVVTKQCAADDCNKKCTFGTEQGKPTHCEKHSHGIVGMREVVAKRCIGPDENGCPRDERAYYGAYCACCHPDEAIRRKLKVTEYRCMTETLKLLGDEVIATEQFRVNFSCMDSIGKCAYVDAVLDNPKIRILFEIDEYRHSSQNYSCERRRMEAVTAELRLQTDDPRPIAWVRFNPDETDGKTKGTPAKQRRRCEGAVTVIRELIANPRDGIFYVNYE